MTKRTPWFAIALVYMTLFSYGLVDNSRGPIFPDLLREFDLSDSRGAWFFSIASATALISNATGAWWLARWGVDNGLRVFCLMWALGLGFISFARDFNFVILGAAVFGLSLGGIGLLVNVVTSRAAPQHLRRQLLSGLHCMYGVSSLLAPLLVTGFYAWGLKWREVFMILALLPLVLAIISFFKPIKADAPEHAHVGKVGPRPWRLALWYSGMLATYVLVEIMVSTRIVLWARRDIGYSVADANQLLSLFFLFLFLGRLYFALVKVSVAHARLQWGAIICTAILFIIGLRGVPIALAATGLTMSFYYPVAMARLSDEAGGHSGFVMAFVLTAQSLLLFTMHSVVGGLSDAIGLTGALWLGPICLVIVMLFLAQGPPTPKHSLAEKA